MNDEVIEVYLRDVDVTLLRENLRLTPEQRLLNLMQLQRFAEELQRGACPTKIRASLTPESAKTLPRREKDE